MSRLRTAKFEDISIANCPSKMERTSPGLNHVFNYEPVRQAFKCFKKFNISGEGDATDLDIICLDAVSPVTADIFKSNYLRKDQDGTGKSLVANGDFFRGGDKAVDDIETAQGSHTDEDARRKLYWRRARIPMNIGWFYEFYLHLACQQYLKNEVTIISSSLNEQEETPFQTEYGLQSDGFEVFRLIIEEKRHTFPFVCL